MPYVTYGHNILASNPNERQLEKIDTLNLKQISTIIGVADTNKVLQKSDELPLNMRDTGHYTHSHKLEKVTKNITLRLIRY